MIRNRIVMVLAVPGTLLLEVVAVGLLGPLGTILVVLLFLVPAAFIFCSKIAHPLDASILAAFGASLIVAVHFILSF